MGLAITAYANHEAALEEGCLDRYHRLNARLGWGDREEGAFEGPFDAEEIDGDGMSYRSYSTFRRHLANVYLGVEIGKAWEPEGLDAPLSKDALERVLQDPLWKLIDYSDCEGVFGPVMVKRIAARFKELDFNLFPSFWRGALECWARVFQAAAEYPDGCVKYH